MLRERFASYLRHAADLVEQGEFVQAAGLERLAREVLGGLGDPPDLLWRLHAQRAERAMRQADYAAAQEALGEAIAVLRASGQAPGRDLFDLLHRLGLARSHQGHDGDALVAFDEAIGVAAAIGPSFYPAAYAHIARAESLRRLARRADAERSLRAAISTREAAPVQGAAKIADAARRALEQLRPARGGGAMGEAPRDPARGGGAVGEAPRDPAHGGGAVGTGESPSGAALRLDEDAYRTALAELDELIGLAGVKAEVRRLAELLRIAAMRRAAGLKTVQVSLHLIFEGGPGTGKTTVARLFGRLFSSLGLLATDRVSEVTRADLVSGYVGQTATKTNEVVDAALDGILFIDEAYALVRPGGQGDFGPEAVAELLKRMEDDRARLAVIVAGYPQEMHDFLESNSGFRSRFGETIHFEDYGPAELCAIFEKFAGDSDYRLDDRARTELARVMERLHATRDRYFANARTVRNLFDDVVAHQAERLLQKGSTPDRDALMDLTATDVTAASARSDG